MDVIIPFYEVMMDRGGYQHFKYHPVAIKPNYLIDYSHNYGIPTQEQGFILDAFTPSTLTGTSLL